ncbi:MAG: prepilin-type N-terminal cleavage/methylation domain-containing protein [Thermoanaerobaculia bacterium]
MRSSIRTPRSRQRGFSLLEMIVVLAVIGILLLIGIPRLLQVTYRYRFTATSRELATLMRVVRIESIRRSLPAGLWYDAATNTFTAFLDSNRNDAYDAGVDRQIGPPYLLPQGVFLWGPTDSDPASTHAIQGWNDNPPASPPPHPGPMFQTDGSVQRLGAFRLKDNGAPASANYLEVRIDNLGTGHVSIQKWFGGGDPDAQWWEDGEQGHRWIW